MAHQSRVHKVAAFDFDGTLTRHDTLVPFLARAAGRRRLMSATAQLGLLGGGGRGHRADRDELKEKMLERLLTGMEESYLRELGRSFATEVLAKRMNTPVLDRLRAHLFQGHQVVIVSASLVYYLDTIAEMIGVDAVIAVEPTVRDGRLDGGLVRPNVRAEQKAIRLREWMSNSGMRVTGADRPDEREVELWAYGNSSGDHELLGMADHRFWLGRQSRVPAGCTLFEPTIGLSNESPLHGPTT